MEKKQLSGEVSGVGSRDEQRKSSEKGRRGGDRAEIK